MNITLSGGHFGGLEVEWPDGTTELEMKDEAGETWLYDLTRSAATDRAEFVGMKPKDR